MTPYRRTGPRAGTRHVLDEATFRSVLVRERKRSDRSSQSVAVVLARATRGGRAPAPWPSVVASLAAAGEPVDVIGWLRAGAVLGLIASEIDRPTAPVVDRLRERIRHELGSRLGRETGAGVSLEVFVHPSPAMPAGDAARPLEGLLEQVRTVPAAARLRDCAKRCLDVTSSMALLLGLAPLLVLIAIVVAFTSPGPVFFRQVRVGEKGRPFTMLKFRTMHVNADDSIHQNFVSRFIEAEGDGGGADSSSPFKLTRDPRVTPIGRVLRRTSLDELPQLWNVLRGEMSLVGPRPPLPYEVERYRPWHVRRVLEARPGMTGLWQVTGRSRTTFDEMVRLDLRYARRRSLLTDIRILLATPRAVFSGRGAC